MPFPPICQAKRNVLFVCITNEGFLQITDPRNSDSRPEVTPSSWVFLLQWLSCFSAGGSCSVCSLSLSAGGVNITRLWRSRRPAAPETDAFTGSEIYRRRNSLQLSSAGVFGYTSKPKLVKRLPTFYFILVFVFHI